MCSCIAVDERCRVVPLFFQVLRTFQQALSGHCGKVKALAKTNSEMSCTISQCLWLVGCLLKCQLFLQNGNNKVLSRKHPNAFSFWPLWNLLKSSRQKPENSPGLSMLCLLVLHNCWGLTSTRKARDLCWEGAMVNEDAAACCFELSPTALQKKLNGKFVFQATNEKMQCFMLPVLYSKFTVVDQLNSSWPYFLECSLVFILRGKATCFSNPLQYLHLKEGNVVWSSAPVLNCLPALGWQFCHVPVSLL